MPQGGDNIPVEPPPVVTPATPQVLEQGIPLGSTIDPNVKVPEKPVAEPEKPLVPDPNAGVAENQKATTPEDEKEVA